MGAIEGCRRKVRGGAGPAAGAEPWGSDDEASCLLHFETWGLKEVRLASGGWRLGGWIAGGWAVGRFTVG